MREPNVIDTHPNRLEHVVMPPSSVPAGYIARATRAVNAVAKVKSSCLYTVLKYMLYFYGQDLVRGIFKLSVLDVDF